MGASLTTLKDSKSSKSDADYSQLHLSAVFNDAYVQSVSEELPEYSLLALQGGKGPDKTENTQSCADTSQAAKFEKLMTILSPSLSESSAQQETESWVVNDTANRKSAFVFNNRNRLRLLLRVYQVYITIPLCSSRCSMHTHTNRMSMF